MQHSPRGTSEQGVPCTIDPHRQWEGERQAMLQAFDGQGLVDDDERLEAALSIYGRLVSRILQTPVMTLEGAAIQLRIIVDDQLDPERYLPDLATHLEAMNLPRQ